MMKKMTMIRKLKESIMKRNAFTAFFAIAAMALSPFATPCRAQVADSQAEGKATEEDLAKAEENKQKQLEMVEQLRPFMEELDLEWCDTPF